MSAGSAGPAVGLPEVLRRIAAADLALVLHESAESPLAARQLPDEGELLLVIGPEGGISEEELEAMTAAGAHAVRLGPTVLRTSTAGVVALAVVSAATGRWS
jgi:16S rRNA (uracil1498-N3)-methyltransferase